LDAGDANRPTLTASIQASQGAQVITQTSPLLKALGYSALVLGATLSIIPFAWMLIAATRTTTEIFLSPPPLFPGASGLENLARLEEETGFGRVVLNSGMLALLYTFFSSLLSAMTGFALAKYQFRGRRALFIVILTTMMVPMQVLLVPLFQIMAQIGWIDTYQAVILPFVANAFGIFLMRQAFMNFPTELLEAARIDGSSELKTFFMIVLPVARPQLAALAIYTFMSQWNAFIWPLLMLNTESNYTIPLALNTMIGLSRVDYSGLMMGSLIATIPVMLVFLVFQRQFVAGLLGGAIKG
jgi:lactose/L-arabinose transport system permease protein